MFEEVYRISEYNRKALVLGLVSLREGSLSTKSISDGTGAFSSFTLGMVETLERKRKTAAAASLSSAHWVRA